MFDDHDVSLFPWRIQAVGHRPVDYMVRDLLFGSLFRDPRAGRFNRLVKEYRAEPPPWIYEQIRHLGRADQQQAIPLLVLWQEWQQFLTEQMRPGEEEKQRAKDESLIEWDPAWDEDDPAETFIMRPLLGCWPMGALLEWAGDEAGPLRKTCGRAWVCPWCYARQVVALHKQLTTGALAAKSQGHHLVSMTASLVPDMVPVDEEMKNLCLFGPGARPCAASWFYEGLNWSWRRLVPNDKYRFFRTRLTRELHDIAQSAGIQGGLVTYQLSPYLTGDGMHGFRHDVNLIGEADLGCPRAIRRFQKALGILGDCPAFATEESERNRIESNVLAFAIPGRTPNALRYLLSGTAVKFPIGQLPLLVHDDVLTGKRGRWRRFGQLQYGPWLDQGLPGAFGWQPLHIFDNFQWDHYYWLTRKLPLYRFFGTWGSQGPAHSAGRRLRALGRASQARKQKTKRRRERLLGMTRQIWPRIRAQLQTKRRGRPAIRAALAQALKQAGCQPSRRDLAWVVKKMSTPRPCSRAGDEDDALNDHVDVL